MTPATKFIATWFALGYLLIAAADTDSEKEKFATYYAHITEPPPAQTTQVPLKKDVAPPVIESARPRDVILEHPQEQLGSACGITRCDFVEPFLEPLDVALRDQRDGLAEPNLRRDDHRRSHPVTAQD